MKLDNKAFLAKLTEVVDAPKREGTLRITVKRNEYNDGTTGTGARLLVRATIGGEKYTTEVVSKDLVSYMTGFSAVLKKIMPGDDTAGTTDPAVQLISDSE